MRARIDAALPPTLRFVLVGAFNTVFGLAIIFALKAGFGAGDVLANAIGYGVGLVVSHVLNGRWTFSFRGRLAARAWRFLLVVGVAYALNLLTVTSAIHIAGLNSYLAQATGVLPYTLTCYFGFKHYVYREHGS